MVRAEYLTPDHLIRAMKKADFYASSGVTLNAVQFDSESKTLKVKIEPDANATYKTDFIVSKKGEDATKIGIVAASSSELESSYQLQEDDLYVRALITSSLKPVDPVWDEQKQQAWTQPFRIESK
jgi:hypothetical protein